MSEKLSDKLGWIGENQSPLTQCLTQTSYVFNSNVEQDLPLPNSLIGALEPLLYSAIMHGLLSDIVMSNCFCYIKIFVFTAYCTCIQIIFDWIFICFDLNLCFIAFLSINPSAMRYGKTGVTSYELQVTSWKRKSTTWN